MRMCAQHRHTTNSNGNQVCPVFCRTQWECTSFVRYEDSAVDRPPTIPKCSDDARRDISLSIATEKCTVVWWQHSVTCRRPPSLPCMVGFCAFRIVFTFGGTQFSSFSRDFFLKSHGSEMQSVQFVFPMVVILGLRNEFCSEWPGPMVEMRTFNRLTGSFCTTSSKPATSVLATGFQFPNAFSDPREQYRSENALGNWTPVTRADVTGLDEVEQIISSFRAFPQNLFCMFIIKR